MLKIIIYFAILLFIFARIAQCVGVCNDQTALTAMGITETCATPSKSILTCNSNNNVIGIAIPQNFVFATTPFGNLDLNCVAKLQTLSILYPTTNKLTGNLQNLPSSLQTLILNYQSISGIDILVKFIPMVTMEISYNANPAFNPSSAFIGITLFTLKTVVLKGNGMTNSQFPILLPLSLVSLDISNNQLTGSLPSSISLLSDLTNLNLAMNSFTGTLNCFTSFNKLLTLDVSYNKFTGIIPNFLPVILTFFNYVGNNLDIGIGGNLKAVGVQVGPFSVELTGNPNGYTPSGAVSIETTNGVQSQLALAGAQSGINQLGTKLLMKNYFGQVNLISAQNTQGETDFNLYGGTTGAGASFTIGGGSTFFARPAMSANCPSNGQQIIVGLTGNPAGNCGYCHSSIYPGDDSFGFLGLQGQRWNSLYVNQAFANTYTTLSDIRAKENLVPLQNVLGKVKTLDAYYYNLKAEHAKNTPNKKTIGLISQQVQKVFPELVIEDGNHLYLEYSKMVPVLVESIKELSDKNDKLEESISELTKTTQSQQEQIDKLTSLVSVLSSAISAQETLIQELLSKQNTN